MARTIASVSEVMTPITGKPDRVKMDEKIKMVLMEAKKGSIIKIYNHPNNATFSQADLYNIARFESSL